MSNSKQNYSSTFAANYGKVAPVKIAKAFKEGTVVKTHNAYTDGRTLFVKGKLIAKKEDDGFVYLRNAGLQEAPVARIIESLANEFSKTSDWQVTQRPDDGSSILSSPKAHKDLRVGQRFSQPSLFKWRGAGRPKGTNKDHQLDS